MFTSQSNVNLIPHFDVQHYSPATYNKNWIYRSDDWLYANRWEELIANRNSIDFVEVSGVIVTSRRVIHMIVSSDHNLE
jgi:hypothetical protein